MSTDDKLSYNGSPLEFLSSFTYLGVVFQTRGGTGGHTDHLRSKGLSSCGKISMRLPLNKLSLPSLERLFLSIVLPSMSYALGTLIQLNPNLTYIDEIQGRLLKMWFGVSKYASSTALMSAVGWTPISDSVKESLLNGTPIGLIRVENAPDLGNGRTRRNLGLGHTNGLHQLWCKSHKCYIPTADCTCRSVYMPAFPLSLYKLPVQKRKTNTISVFRFSICHKKKGKRLQANYPRFPNI